MRFKCRETGEGEIHPYVEKATVTFKDGTLQSFTGRADFPWMDKDQPFSGRKVSDTPSSTHPRHPWVKFGTHDHV